MEAQSNLAFLDEQIAKIKQTVKTRGLRMPVSKRDIKLMRLRDLRTVTNSCLVVFYVIHVYTSKPLSMYKD